MIIRKGSSLHLCSDAEGAVVILGWLSGMMRLEQVSSFCTVRHFHYDQVNSTGGSRPLEAQLGTVLRGYVDYGDPSLARAASAGVPFCHNPAYDETPAV